MDNNESYKAIINIAGGCICRDTFSLQENNGGYKIKQFVGKFAPLLASDNKPIEFDEDAYWNFDCTGYVTNFIKRCIYLDLTRQTPDYIKKEKSDFLILDAALNRRNFFQLGKPGTEALVFGENRNLLDALHKAGILPPITGVYDFYSFSEEEIRERITNYVNSYLDTYTIDQIILFDVSPVYLDYYPDTNTVKPFTNMKPFEEEYKKISFVYEIMKELLDGCHLVPMPKYALADHNHKFGTYPWHFTQEYYDFTFACIETINERLPREQEIAKINRLKQEYEYKYLVKYHDSIVESFYNLGINNNLNVTRVKRFEEYSNFFQTILENNISLTSFFKKNNIGKVAFYGYNRISSYLIKELSKTDICVEYLMHDNLSPEFIEKTFTSKNIFINVVPKNNNEPYSEVDAIIVSDIIHDKKIIANLKKLTNLPIYSASDIIKQK